MFEKAYHNDGPADKEGHLFKKQRAKRYGCKSGDRDGAKNFSSIFDSYQDQPITRFSWIKLQNGLHVVDVGQTHTEYTGNDKETKAADDDDDDADDEYDDDDGDDEDGDGDEDENEEEGEGWG